LVNVKTAEGLALLKPTKSNCIAIKEQGWMENRKKFLFLS
jgi:hypothetical protein